MCVSGVCISGLICQRGMVLTPCPVANATTEHQDTYLVSVSMSVCVCVCVSECEEDNVMM